MIELSDHSGGVILPVRAQPGARITGVLGEQAGALKLAINAPPQDGRANEALVELLRKLLGVKRSQITLLSGAASRDKKFQIDGLTRRELEERLRSLLG